jgi:hypothetical protein
MNSRYGQNGRPRFRGSNGQPPRGEQSQDAPEVVQPVFELTYPGGVRAAVWENDGNDGQLYYSITISRRYRDQKDGEWKSGTRFSPTELLAISMAAQQAFLWCMEHPLERNNQSTGGERS